MNDREKNFLRSIETKIRKYDIPITVKEALGLSQNRFIETQYNDGSVETVDARIEYEFCKLSAFYFISKYGYIHFPGIGIIPYTLYHFQAEILRDTANFRKLVFLKTRQAGISTLFSLYAFWLGNFHESENIDVVSIKQKKAHAFTKKMFPTMDRLPDFLKTPIVKRNMAEIEWANGSYMLSESASDKAGRGDSLSLLILDELAFYRSDNLTRGIVSAAQPTLTRTGGSQILISCVPKETHVFTNKGIIQIEDLLQEDMKLGFSPVPIFKLDGLENQQVCNLMYYSGKSDTIKLTTKLGFSIEGTPIHPLLAYSPTDRFFWKRLRGFQKNDMVVIKEGMESFGNISHTANIRINESTAYMFGKILMKGSVDNRSETLSIPFKINEFFRIVYFAKLYNARVKVSKGTIHLTSSRMVEILRQSCLFKDCLPKQFMRMNKANTKAFLRGCFGGNEFDILVSDKKEVLEKLQLMLLNIGILTKRTERTLTTAEEHGFRLNEYIIDGIEKIESFQGKDTYDFYVPKTNTFVSNGIVSHNTPNGMSGPGSYYAEQVHQLQMVGGETRDSKLVVIDWYEIPDIDGITPYRGFNDVIEKYTKLDYYRNEKIRKQMRDFFKPIGDNPLANEYLKKQYEDLGPILYRQEIEHDFIVSGDQVFPEEILDQVKNRVLDPVSKNMLGTSRVNGLCIWKYPVPKKRYIIGVDSSTGTGSDFSTIQVMDVESYEQVAEYKGQVATKTFGKLVKKVARYYNEAYTVIECNSIGEAVFNEVYYSEEEPYRNVYKQSKTTKDGRSRVTGWETNVKTRQLMVNNLIDFFTVKDLFDELKVYSDRLYKEMLSFVWVNGKAMHTTNGHDDTLIALGLCLYFRNKANIVGDSFIVNEDGDFIGTEDIRELEEVKINENEFDFITSEDSEDFEDTFGMTRDQYDWLLN